MRTSNPGRIAITSPHPLLKSADILIGVIEEPSRPSNTTKAILDRQVLPTRRVVVKILWGKADQCLPVLPTVWHRTHEHALTRRPLQQALLLPRP